MSGPKINRYDLSPKARKNLNEQMRCERQSITKAKTIRQLLWRLLESKGPVEHSLAKLQLLQQRTGGYDSEISALENFLSHFDRSIAGFEALLQAVPHSLSQKYTLTDTELQKRKDLLKRLQGMERSLLAYSEPMEKALAACDGDSEAQTTLLEKSIADDLSQTASFDIRRPEKKDILRAKKQAAADQLTTLLLQENCPASMKAPLRNAVQSIERISSDAQLKTFLSVTADPLQKRYDAALKAAADERAKYEELIQKYISLCELTGIEAREIPKSTDALEKLICEIEEHLLEDREQEYIAACLDEVMIEMGYDLIGSRTVTKKSGKWFRSELYTFCEGTAVNVTYSSDGQIAMELGGLDHEDRLPAEEEVDVLVEDMESFCADFEEIERRLAAKGIIPGTRIAMSPPKAEYAAIINAEDYDIPAGKVITQMHTVVKRKKAAVKKSIHRGDE